MSASGREKASSKDQRWMRKAGPSELIFSSHGWTLMHKNQPGYEGLVPKAQRKEEPARAHTVSQSLALPVSLEDCPLPNITC